MTTTTRTLPKGENEKTRASERVTGKKEAKKIKVERGLPLSLFFFAEATCETRGRDKASLSLSLKALALCPRA